MVEDSTDEIIGRDALGVRLEAGEHPVPEHVASQGLDVVWRHEVAADQEGLGASRRDQGQRGTGTGSQFDQRGEVEAIAGRISCGPDQVDRVLLDRRSNPDRGSLGTQGENLGRADQRSGFLVDRE